MNRGKVSDTYKDAQCLKTEKESTKEQRDLKKSMKIMIQNKKNEKIKLGIINIDVIDTISYRRDQKITFNSMETTK